MSAALRRAVEGQLPPGDEDIAIDTAVAGLALMRSTGATIPRKARLYRPALCLVVQGAKEMALGDRVFRYGEGQALVVSLEVPAAGRVVEASPERPYLAIALELDTALIAEVLAELQVEPASERTPALGLFVATIDAPLAGAFERLLALLETPAAIPVLGRQTIREIYYWLLAGPNGPAIARLTSPEGHAQRIARALRLLRENFAASLRIADLARAAGMSPSGFHQHFKALTGMTPLQYQKHLRLIEARNLIAAEMESVSRVAYRVGYESPSQFSREYSRLFGVPPRRHAVQQRGLSA
jgi:AraC-like DNA-binding protein